MVLTYASLEPSLSFFKTIYSSTRREIVEFYNYSDRDFYPRKNQNKTFRRRIPTPQLARMNARSCCVVRRPPLPSPVPSCGCDYQLRLRRFSAAAQHTASIINNKNMPPSSLPPLIRARAYAKVNYGRARVVGDQFRFNRKRGSKGGDRICLPRSTGESRV